MKSLVTFAYEGNFIIGDFEGFNEDGNMIVFNGEKTFYVPISNVIKNCRALISVSDKELKRSYI